MGSFINHILSELPNLVSFLALFTQSFWIYPFILFFFTILIFKLISRSW